MSLMTCKGSAWWTVLAKDQSDTNAISCYAVETNQPNCVVGAFCMYANETLNVKLSPNSVQTNNPLLNKKSVEVLDIQPAWNELFPSNHIYNVTYEDDVHIDIPYLWVGYYQTNTAATHACLVYFHTNSVTYKHFLYLPTTHTNYMTTTNYEYFFKHTVRIYTSRQENYEYK